MKEFIAGTDIDGFRLDAAKHVTEDFVAQFSTEIRDYARSLGKNNFLVIGEVAADADWIGRRLGVMFTNPNDPSQHGNVPVSLTTKIEALQSTYLADPSAPYPGLNAVYDFDASGTSRDALLMLRQSSDVATYFDSDYYNTIAGQADYRLSWTHLEIHDWPRFLQTQPANSAVAQCGAAYLLTVPGQPIIWMGFEQGFNQNCQLSGYVNAGAATANITELCNDGSDDTLKRQDMFIGGPWRLGSAIPAINQLAYIGVWTPEQTTADWTQDPFLNREHAQYISFRKLTHIRRSCSPLTQGSLVWRNAQPKVGGLLMYSRIFNGAEMVVVLNPSPNSVSIPPIPIDNTVNYNAAYQTYVNLLDGFQTATVGYQNGQAYLYLPNGFLASPYAFLIFAHSNNTAPYDSYLQTQLCKQ
ncbi:MAG: alpha-amylase family glycosyl hydrolase [archaeon]|nr:alpha-amylase family glycosyl hydrolase [archaeon]